MKKNARNAEKWRGRRRGREGKNAEIAEERRVTQRREGKRESGATLHAASSLALFNQDQASSSQEEE